MEKIFSNYRRATETNFSAQHRCSLLREMEVFNAMPRQIKTVNPHFGYWEILSPVIFFRLFALHPEGAFTF